MRQRIALVVLVVAAVAVAGCTSNGGSDPAYGDTGGDTGAPTTSQQDQGSQQTTQEDTTDQQDGDGGQKAVEVVSGVSPDRTIDLTNYEFSNTNPSIYAGTVVKFVNTEGSHTVTLDTAGIDRTVSGSQSVTVRFNEEGTYQVYCRFHGSPGSGMHSNVNAESTGDSSGGTQSGGGYNY